MTKLSDNYCTPKNDFWDVLNEVTPFFWDACSNRDNCLANDMKYYLTQPFGAWANDGYEYDYLTTDMVRISNNLYHESRQDRYDTIFINPPYSKKTKNHPGVEGFIRKAWEDSKHFRVVMLLKADMSTDWFNYIIKENNGNCEHINQGEMTIKEAYKRILGIMSEHTHYLKPHPVGTLHLRKRVKFLADEEMMVADTNAYIRTSNNRKVHYLDKYNNENHDILLETKNFKRGADGLIYPKSGPTFPSMLAVLDRRNV